MKAIVTLAICLVFVFGNSLFLKGDASEVSPESSVAQSTPEPAPETGDAQLYSLTGLPCAYPNARPVAVSVAPAARQLGLSTASVVLEGLVEGQQTNMAALYNSVWEVSAVGPVTQGKDLLWQFAMAENAILVQNGWNLYAQNLLNCYNYQPIDARIEGTNAFFYDNGPLADVPSELAWNTQGVTIYDALESYGITWEGESNPIFSFGTPAAPAEKASALWVQYSATTGTAFTYDAASNTWLMTNALTGPQIDANNGAQVGFANVFLLSAKGGVKDNGYTREYDLTGGKGLYLTADGYQPITWTKGDVTAPLMVYAADGTPLTVATGNSYIGIYGGFAGQSVSLTTASGTKDASMFQ